MNKYQIVPAHWSKNPNDSHSLDDADCTYMIKDENGECYGIFNKLAEAEEFISNNHP